MKASYIKNNEYDCIVIWILGETPDEDIYFAYDSNEKWNGEYYKGWRSDENGYQYSFDNRIYKIRPLYDDKDGWDYEVELLN